MNKTTTITLAGILFHLEDHAYQKLKAYLDEIKAYFDQEEGGDEIVSDIESRIAELFSGKDQKIVTDNTVDEVIKNMGTVKDFQNEDEMPEKKQTKPRKLFRDPDDRMLGGVSSGIAHFFGIDPMIVRILFVLLTCFWGVALVLYILLWVFLPKAETATQKELMYGSFAPTLISIRNKAEKMTKGLQSENRRKFYGGMKKVISALFRAGFFIVGAIILLGSFALGVFFTFLTVLFAIDQIPAYINFPIATAAYGTIAYFIVLATGFLTFLIPCLMGMLVGWYLIIKKSFIGKFEFLAVVGIWIICLIIGGMLFAQTAPGYEKALEKQQEIPTVRTIPVSDFTSVQVSDGGRYFVKGVNIIKGTTTSVRVQSNGVIDDNFDVIVRNGTLEIDSRGFESFCILCHGDARPVTLTITTPTLLDLELRGVEDAKVDDFKLDQFTLSTSDFQGAFAFDAKEADINLYDGSRVTMGGTIGELDLSLYGDSYFAATTSPIRNASAEIHNHSNANMNVSGDLNGEVEGNSTLTYSGNPEVEVDTYRGGKVENGTS